MPSIMQEKLIALSQSPLLYAMRLVGLDSNACATSRSSSLGLSFDALSLSLSLPVLNAVSESESQKVVSESAFS